VILVKDALDYVKECIRTLNSYTDNFELIIVDNGSNKKTKDWLKKLDWLDYTLIENEENMGFSYGCNQGIKAAKYDYVCFLNSDTRLTPNWLGKLMRGFKYHKDVGIVGPSTCHCSTIQSVQVLRGKHEITDQSLINQMAESLKEHYTEAMVVGFCFVISKKVFNKIGVFDHHRYGIATHEDIDLLWRADKAGFKSVWCMASYVHHFGNKTTREMGLNPRKLRNDNLPIFVERKNDPNLYVENDVEIERIKQVKGRIPILMITWNRLEYTKQAIEAIRKYTTNYKLFIWDNGSKDGTKDYIKSLDGNNLIKHYEPVNRGLVPPMNVFFDKFSDYRYVAKVDNDTVVTEGWLDKLKEVMEEYPFFAIEANHYLMLNYDIKTNDDYYNELFSIDFKDSKIYLAEIVGGTGTIIRRSRVNYVSDIPGTLSGWIQYQHNKNFISGFYTGVWVDRLDQVDTNKYKEPSDYPEYDEKIDILRPPKRVKKKIRNGIFKDTYKRTKEWYERI
jgi:GT2 family glycosyltransferase